MESGCVQLERSTECLCGVRKIPPSDADSLLLSVGEAVIKNLSGRGPSKPRKLKTLANTINNLFTEKLSDQELDNLIDQMTSTGQILVKDGNVSYRLKL